MTFAALGFHPDRIAAMVVNALAVGGGFLAGFVLTGIAAHYLDKWLARGQSPAGLHRAVRYVGGVCGAILVVLLVFGDGTGRGPGDGPGTTPFTGAGTGTTAVTAAAQEPVSPVAPPVPDTPPGEEVVRVTVLSGVDVVEQRFYVIEGDPAALTLDALKRELAARKKVAAKPLTVQVVLGPRANSDGSGVQSLIGAAQAAGYGVKLPKPQ